jgi:hypothetical protein
MRTFFFHYNKPASLKVGRVQVSVHYKNTCHVVDNVQCNVPVHGHVNKRQPRFVMKGKASELTIKDNVAYIT